MVSTLQCPPGRLPPGTKGGGRGTPGPPGAGVYGAITGPPIQAIFSTGHTSYIVSKSQVKSSQIITNQNPTKGTPDPSHWRAWYLHGIVTCWRRLGAGWSCWWLIRPQIKEGRSIDPLIHIISSTSSSSRVSLQSVAVRSISGIHTGCS